MQRSFHDLDKPFVYRFTTQMQPSGFSLCTMYHVGTPCPELGIVWSFNSHGSNNWFWTQMQIGLQHIKIIKRNINNMKGRRLRSASLNWKIEVLAIGYSRSFHTDSPPSLTIASRDMLWNTPNFSHQCDLCKTNIAVENPVLVQKVTF